MKLLRNCPFCYPDILIERANLAYPALEHSKIIYLETINFISTIDLHPIIPESTHFLIFPKLHYNSFAELPPKFQKELKEHVNYLKKCIITSFPDSKKNLLTFEHGRKRYAEPNKSTYHARWNLVFTDYQAEKILRFFFNQLLKLKIGFNLAYKPLVDNVTICGCDKHNRDYLYLSVNNTKINAINHKNSDIYSHFFKPTLAEACSVPFLDWKKANPNELEIFRQRLLNNLPINIKKI